MLASESLLTLESIATSFQKFFEKFREENGNQMHSGIQGALGLLRSKLGLSAVKLLKHNWETKHLENGWKNKVRPFCFNLFCLFTIFFCQVFQSLHQLQNDQDSGGIINDFITLFLELYSVFRVK